MKPLDLERFENDEPKPYEIHVVGDKQNAYAVANAEQLSLLTVVTEDKKQFAGFYLRRDAEQFIAIPQLVAELKALRVWRKAVNDALWLVHGSLPKSLIESWRKAETELNNATT